MTRTATPTADQIARQLLTRQAPTSVDPAATGDALQRACIRLSENLRRSVGNDGHNALLARALAHTQRAHPELMEIRRASGDDIYLDGVAATVQAHGAPAVSAALESLFASLIGVLSGLIGADMVLNLLDHDSQPLQAPSGRQPE